MSILIITNSEKTKKGMIIGLEVSTGRAYGFDSQKLLTGGRGVELYDCLTWKVTIFDY